MCIDDNGDSKITLKIYAPYTIYKHVFAKYVKTLLNNYTAAIGDKGHDIRDQRLAFPSLHC